MPLFRGPKNLHLGFDESTNQPEVASQYDAEGRHYIVRLSAAAKKKWQQALEEAGFAEERDGDSKIDTSKADDSKE